MAPRDGKVLLKVFKASILQAPAVSFPSLTDKALLNQIYGPKRDNKDIFMIHLSNGQLAWVPTGYLTVPIFFDKATYTSVFVFPQECRNDKHDAWKVVSDMVGQHFEKRGGEKPWQTLTDAWTAFANSAGEAGLPALPAA